MIHFLFTARLSCFFGTYNESTDNEEFYKGKECDILTETCERVANINGKLTPKVFPDYIQTRMLLEPSIRRTLSVSNLGKVVINGRICLQFSGYLDENS